MGGLDVWNKIKRLLLPKEIHVEQLQPGDHIYTCRQDSRKHHGIYVGDGKVIHLCTLAALSDKHRVCSLSVDRDKLRQEFVAAVASTPLHEFVSGGKLYLYEYGVKQAHFSLAKLWEYTCTLASSDPPQVVRWRSFFLHYSNYNCCTADHFRFINNSEDFAIYCKTGLLVVDSIEFESRILQTAFFWAITAAVFVDIQQQLMLSATFFGLLGRYIGICCVCRLAPDIGLRPNVIKVGRVERLPKVDEVLASAGIRYLLVLFVLSLAFFLSLPSPPWSKPLQAFDDIVKVAWFFVWIVFFYGAVLQRRLLSNKMQKEQLKPGDHIFTYRNAHAYSHHGIYVGDNKVIHLQRGADPISGGGGDQRECRVQSCCMDCFLDGGELYLYKYGVNFAFFMAKTRGGTCTISSPYSAKLVMCRARFVLLRQGDFGAYNIFDNNCEDFAVYCKTGLHPFRIEGKNGQIGSLYALSFAITFTKSLKIPASYFIDKVAAFYFVYSMIRLTAESGETGKYEVPIKKLPDAVQSRHYMRTLIWICLIGSICVGFEMIKHFGVNV